MRQALNHSYRFPQRAESVRTLCIRLPKVVLFLFLLLGAGSLAAQNTDQQIAAQKRLIADLEKQIAREEQEISKLKKGRASAEETVRRLARQIDSRNQLLDVTERDARKLEVEVARTDSVARGLSASLDAHKRRYAEMVREAYRNYKHNNYLTYLFSSSDFNQVARRITNLREVAAMRERQMEQIVTLSEQVSVERTRLTGQQRALDSVKRSLTTQRTRLQKDSQAARANIKQLVGGAGEETVLARVGEGIVSSIGSADSHKIVLENPDSISRVVLEKGLDAGTAFEILSIDIADIDVGKNIGAQLQMDQAQADKNIAQAKAEERRAMAVALEQENKAKAQDARAKVILAEAEVPLAMAEAFRNGNLGIMDYYKMKNIMADTSMRESIARPEKK